MKHKKITALILSCAFALSGCGGAGQQGKEHTQETQSADVAGDTEAWQKAEESPYAAYPELVTYTLGQMSGVNNSNLPDGDTYEISSEDVEYPERQRIYGTGRPL